MGLSNAKTNQSQNATSMRDTLIEEMIFEVLHTQYTP
jgi:hypothetical protein